MHWQETVLAVGQIVFIVALLPSLFSRDKPEIWTSIITGTVALSIAITYATMNLPLAAISALFNFIFWSILAVQKYRQKKYPKAVKRRAS
ncbi:hypothetical protein M1512_01360 [Patescibacteria group bacterium]|jgi:hypothetical protein|nr:hypothetical protein [Patescibacteria group bacterium]